MSITCGLSTQDTAYQREAAERLHLPFPLLSDENLELANAMRITRDDVGRVETPGWVTVRGRLFEVKQEHIDAWREDPDGAWTLVRIGHDDEDAQWVLDTFDPSS